jgi:hypothetical protein
LSLGAGCRNYLRWYGCVDLRLGHNWNRYGNQCGKKDKFPHGSALHFEHIAEDYFAAGNAAPKSFLSQPRFLSQRGGLG